MADEIKRAIEIAETVPFRYFIQHIASAAKSSMSASLTPPFPSWKSWYYSHASAAWSFCLKIPPMTSPARIAC